jgi:hypothetical protein
LSGKRDNLLVTPTDRNIPKPYRPKGTAWSWLLITDKVHLDSVCRGPTPFIPDPKVEVANIIYMVPTEVFEFCFLTLFAEYIKFQAGGKYFARACSPNNATLTVSNVPTATPRLTHQFHQNC